MKKRSVVVLAGLLAAGGLCRAAAAAPPAAKAGELRVPIEEFKLDNGLRVVLSEDHATPIVAVAVYYKVGSRDEAKGRSGFAHLFEHMMFQGSAHVKKGEFFEQVENNGGVLNGSTHTEYTNYFEMMPSDRLELALWLEADRMRSLAVTADNLKNQQEVVKEEKRLRIDNQPYGAAQLKLPEMLYRNWANAHSVIGSMEDLDAAKLEDVQAFFKSHYAPNNAVLVIAGDFDPAEAREWAKRHFGAIPSQKLPDAPDLRESGGVAQADAVMPDPLANVPAIFFAWKVPGRTDTSAHAIDLLTTILGDGDSSLLHQRLVKEKEMAVSAETSYGEEAGPASADVTVVLRPGADPARVTAEIEDVLTRIRDKGVTKEELDRAKALGRYERFAGGLFGLQTPLGRALALGWASTFEKEGPEAVNRELARMEAVTPEDVRDAARHLFTPGNRVRIEVAPGKTGEKPAGGAR
jgi:zinc protease